MSRSSPRLPTPGRYLLYLDFQVDGKVHTAPFVVDTTGPQPTRPATPTPPTQDTDTPADPEPDTDADSGTESGDGHGH